MKYLLKKLYYWIYEKKVSGKKKKGNVNLERYRDSHVGEKCFIICTGPSLTINDLDLLKDEFTISMNSIVNVYDKCDFRPNIYIIQDPFVFNKISTSKTFAETLNTSDCFYGEIIRYKNRKKKFDDRINFYNLSLMGHNLLKNDTINFSNDFSKIVYDGFSVTYSAIQLAFFMGFSEIYLLGNDCDYSKTVKHFDEKDNPENKNDIVYDTSLNMINAYKFLKSYLEDKACRVYNSTRGGKLEVFERVSLEDAIKKS